MDSKLWTSHVLFRLHDMKSFNPTPCFEESKISDFTSEYT